MTDVGVRHLCLTPSLIVSLVMTVAALQIAGPRPPPPPPPAPWSGTGATLGTSTIRGRVLRIDGRPLARANVRLLAESGPPLRGVETDADGQYEFTELPAGLFRVAAAKPGYVNVDFGQVRADERGVPVALANGETRDHVDITAPRLGAIVGRIVDENGDPVENVNMRAFASRYSAGRRRLVAVADVGGRSNDLGKYRIYGLPPGRYFVSATVGEVQLNGPANDVPGYAPTYFPGTPSAAEGQPVAVGLSADVTGIDFAIVPGRTTRVAGTAFNVDGAPVTGGLQLVPSDRSGATGLPMGARIEPDGSFEFPNVAPGDYVIQAFKSRQSSWKEGEFGAMPVSVNGSDVTGLLVQMLPGSTITGRVTFDNSVAGRPDDVSIVPVIIDLDRSLAQSGPPTRAEMHDDWTFQLAGISGPRRLRVTRVPRGWAVRGVFINGIDVTDSVLSFGTRAQSLTDVEVALTSRITGLSGAVVDGRNQACARCVVLVFPTDRERWYHESRFFSLASTRDDGSFTIRGLPPADYHIVAVDRMRESERGGEWQDPDFLEALARNASRVTIHDGQTVSVTARVIAR